MSVWPEWKIKDFSQGMVDKVDDNLLPDNASQDCQNFICKILGVLRTRNGQEHLNSSALDAGIHGLYAYYKSSSRYLVAVAGTNVYKWDTTATPPAFSSIKSGVNATAQMYFETCANFMVGMNGVDAAFKWDGTTVTALANAPVGYFPTLFKEKLFCVPASNTSQIWWSESFYPETWPATYYWSVKSGDGDSITGLIPYLGELVVLKRRSIHSFRGNSIDDFSLTEQDSRIGCVSHQAAVVAGTKIYFVSDEGLYAYNGMKATPIHSERIPKLWDNINKEYINKACVTYWGDMVWFSLPLQNQLNLQITTACTLAGNATVTLGGVSKTVVLALTDDTADKVATKIRALTLDGWTVSGSADTVTFVRNELKPPLTLEYSAGATGASGTVTEVDQTTNNLVLVYDPEGGQFWPMSGIDATCFQIYNGGSDIKLYAGSSDGYVNQQDVGTEDYGNAINAYYVTKAFDQQSAERLKKAKKLFVEDLPNQENEVTVQISRDYGEYESLDYKAGDGLIREYRFPSSSTKWRYITFKISHNASGECEVRGVMAPIKMKNKPKVRG